MICLCLTYPHLEENRAALEQYRPWIGLAELRMDRLRADQFEAIPAFLHAAWRDLGIAFILTARLAEDGGSWAFSEDERRSLIREVLLRTAALSKGQSTGCVTACSSQELLKRGPVAWVDLESGLDFAGLDEEIMESGSGVIRSFHDFTLTPQNLEKRIHGLWDEDNAGKPGFFMPKAAVMVRGSRDFLTLCKAAKALQAQGRPFILAGMGPFGVASRILANYWGSYLTFSSPTDPQHSAAPGHMDPRLLGEVYGVERITPRTRIFGIAANPVLHSKSPAYHNGVFIREGLDGVYMPFQVDDLGAFMETAQVLDIQGFSVTIPHKEAVRAFLDVQDPGVEQIGSCNTVLRRKGGWLGMNTDAPGFLNPLLPLLESASEPIEKALVIGAGGAARGIIQPLLARGISVLILNRTPERAEELAREFGAWYPGKVSHGGLETCTAQTLKPYSRLIVQTSSAGMEGKDEHTDPLPGYVFDGAELVYDIVYVPERTVFLRRAEAAGCTVMNGMPMFQEQARLQSLEFKKNIPAAMALSEKEA